MSTVTGTLNSDTELAPRPTPPRGRRGSSLRGVVLTLALTLATVTAVMALWLRWEADPSRPLLIGLQGVSPLLLLAAALTAAVALWRRWLVSVSIIFVGAVVTVGAVAPDWGRQQGDAIAVGAIPLRVASANLLMNNPRVGTIAAELVSADADVILVQEVTPASATELAATIPASKYPYSIVDPRTGGYGSAIYSTLPLAPGPMDTLAGWPITSAQVITANGPVDVINVHLAAPLSTDGHRVWRQQLAELGEVLEPGTRLDDNRRPILAMGDFNGTRWHPAFAALLDRGSRDAFTVAGRGVGFTWRPLIFPVPVMRIDHALVDARLGIHGARVGTGAGSDHRPIVVELSVPSKAR